MASNALLQTSSLPDWAEMLHILSFYGPETIPRNLDLRHLKPDQCYVEYVFKEWNPTFASQFYGTNGGKWLPHMGVSREIHYQLQNVIYKTPQTWWFPITVCLPKGKR
jgi:hypothetical protein